MPVIQRLKRFLNSDSAYVRAVLIGLGIAGLVLIPLTCSRKSTPVAQPKPETDYMVRVLLHRDTSSVKIGPADSLRVYAVDKNGILKLIQQFHGTGDSVQVRANANKLFIGPESYDCKKMIIEPVADKILKVNENKWRGNIQILLKGSQRLDVINRLHLENYLLGVVGAEMPAYWQSQALKAQAVAARTYCLYIKKRYGKNRTWDLRRTQANQVYKGLQAESRAAANAVEQTAGLVLTCDKAPQGPQIFPTFYSSSCGGHTESSKKVFGQGWPCLAAVDCPHCIDIARPDFYYWPTVEMSYEKVTARLAKRYTAVKPLGRIVKIKPLEETDYGTHRRILRVRLTGENGKTVTLRGEDLRLALDPTGMKIRSTIFQVIGLDNKWVFINGRGFGHGVGLCQSGAQAMARQGSDFRQILKHYYKGSRLIKLDYKE